MLAEDLGRGPALLAPPEALEETDQSDNYRRAIDEIKELFNSECTRLDPNDLRHLATTQRASELGALITKGLASLSVCSSTESQ